MVSTGEGPYKARMRQPARRQPADPDRYVRLDKGDLALALSAVGVFLSLLGVLLTLGLGAVTAVATTTFVAGVGVGLRIGAGRRDGPDAGG